MPVVHPLPNTAEPDKPFTALSFGPDIWVSAFRQSIVVGFESYASAAAAANGGEPVAKSTAAMVGPRFRNFIRANPQLYLDLLAAVDAFAVQVFPDATAVPGQLPAWASEPIEPEE